MKTNGALRFGSLRSEYTVDHKTSFNFVLFLLLLLLLVPNGKAFAEADRLQVAEKLKTSSYFVVAVFFFFWESFAFVMATGNRHGIVVSMHIRMHSHGSTSFNRLFLWHCECHDRCMATSLIEWIRHRWICRCQGDGVPKWRTRCPMQLTHKVCRLRPCTAEASASPHQSNVVAASRRMYATPITRLYWEPRMAVQSRHPLCNSNTSKSMGHEEMCVCVSATGSRGHPFMTSASNRTAILFCARWTSG